MSVKRYRMVDCPEVETWMESDEGTLDHDEAKAIEWVRYEDYEKLQLAMDALLSRKDQELLLGILG